VAPHIAIVIASNRLGVSLLLFVPACGVLPAAVPPDARRADL